MIDGAVHFQKRRGFRQANNNLVENIQFSRKGVFQGFRDKIGPLSSNRCLSKSDAQYERKSSALNTFIEKKLGTY